MADKKLFELLEGTPSASDKLAYGKAGSTYKNITYDNFKDLIVAAVPEPEVKVKVFNIGAYDMYPNEKNKDVDLTGMARNKIRSAQVMILSNNGGLYPLAMQGDNDEIRSYWWIRQEPNYATNARVSIRSNNNSFFDNEGAFNGNGPGGNRGYITIWYVD